MLLQLRLLLKLLRKAVADSVDAADATEYHHQHHHHYKLVIIIVIITLSGLLKVIKTTDDKFDSLPFLTNSIKSLLYRSEKSIICAVFVTFVVFDRLSVAKFPSVGRPARVERWLCAVERLARMEHWHEPRHPDILGGWASC
jgi:hypothetical protein